MIHQIGPRYLTIIFSGGNGINFASFGSGGNLSGRRMKLLMLSIRLLGHLVKVSTEILFWDKADYDNEDSWTSYDNTGEVALNRYKKASVSKIFHESINVVKISKV